MVSAARNALNQAVARGESSFATAATVTERFRLFVAYVRRDGIGRMEQITPEVVTRYGQHLAEQVVAEELSAAYAQNLVSAINTVMNLATQGVWNSVSPTAGCAIAKRSHVRQLPPTGLDRQKFRAALADARSRGFWHGAAVAELARQLGLRTKEASLLNAVAALHEAKAGGHITISSGTKGGRTRQIPVSQIQIEVLARAAALQSANRSLVPQAQTWAAFRTGELRDTRELLQAHGITRLHELRAAYACERYQNITGKAAPVLGGNADRDIDQIARLQIAQELGHGRIDVTNSYLGGRGR